MLQAKTEYGEYVTLALLNRDRIMRIKRRTQFFCPACNKPVIAKAGNQVVPHFAHRSKSNCPSLEGGESVYHEKGKLLLYQWLVHQHLDAHLEAYLPAINQRPDILLNVNHKVIAMEYQCARIPLRQIIDRNNGYYSQGIEPIWILGGNQFKRLNQMQVKLDNFQLHFIHQFSSDFPVTLYYFCPNTLHFILFQDFYLLTLRKAAGRLLIKKLPQMTVTDLFQASWFQQKDICHLWQYEKRSLRLRPPGRLYGHAFAWQQWLYMNQLHRETLPAVVYLPVPDQFRMVTPLWDWQSRLYIDVIAPLGKGDAFSLQHCLYYLRQHMQDPRITPLIKPTNNPVYQYLKLLESLHFIQETTSGMFVQKQAAPFYEHVEDALNHDKVILEEMTKQNTGMKLV